MRYLISLGLVIISPLCDPVTGLAQAGAHGELADEPLVDVAKVDPSIVIDLRYATPCNVTGHPIYPPGTRCMIRSGVAERLKVAQLYLHRWGRGLKIWDAYRPSYAQKILWDHVKNYAFTADPAKGRALHSWGVAVDVTLVDLKGRDVPMPTDFDDFTPAAKDEYEGHDPVVAWNFNLLKHAMHRAGFYGFHPEWWHYMAQNWKSYSAIPTVEMQ